MRVLATDPEEAGKLEEMGLEYKPLPECAGGTSRDGPGTPGTVRVAILLAALLAGALWSVVLGERSFFHIDIFYEHIPVWQAVQDALRRGVSPFWLDGEFTGHPFLYHQEAPLFYPLTLPLLLTGAPAHRLIDAFSLCHLWLAGLAAFWLVEDRTRDRAAAFVAAVAYMLSMRTLGSSIWPNAVAVTAYVPLLLLGLLWTGDGERRGPFLSAAAGGLMLLLARPQAVWGAAPLILSTAAYAVVASSDRKRCFRSLILAGVVAIAVGGASLVPTAALHGEMSRAGGLLSEERNVVALGSQGNEVWKVFLPVSGLQLDPEACSFPGVVPALLFAGGAAFAFRNGNAAHRGLYLALLAGGVVGLAFAFGEAGPYRLISGLPVLRGLRAPARFLGSWSAAVALGAGLSAAWLSRRKGGASLVRIALALTVVDLVTQAWRAAPTAPREVFTTPSPLAAHLRSLPRDEAGFPPRVWTFAGLTFGEGFAREGAAELVRLEPLALARGMGQGLETVTGGGPPLRRVGDLLQLANLRCAELAAVGRVVLGEPQDVVKRDESAPEGFFVGVPTATLPRAFIVDRIVWLPPQEALSALFSSAFDPRRAVILEADRRAAEGLGRPGGKVTLLSRVPGRVDLTYTSPASGVLVLLDSFARGWSVEVDGTGRPLLRANHAYRAVRVPAGSHRVTFRYRPPGLREGIAISAAGLLGLVFLAGRSRRAPAP